MELRDHRFYRFFDAPYVQLLLNASVVKKIAQDAILFEEDDEPDAVYLVLGGSIVLSKKGSSGQRHQIATVCANDYFGEFGLIDGLGRSARAAAAEPSTVARIGISSLRDVVNEGPGRSLLHISQKIAGDVRQTNQRVIHEIVHKEKLSMVGEMARSIMHDFKSPFSVIKMASQMLETSESAEEVRQFSQLIQAQIDRMVAMTGQVLEYSRGTHTLVLAPVMLAHLLETFDTYNRQYLESNQVQLDIEPCEARIQADEGKLLRVLQNLVNNGAEAMPDGGTIRVHCCCVGDQVEIRISDEGPGVPEEIRATLFDPFVTHGKRSGTGLGTAIAKTLVEAHGGRIELTNDSPGATFLISLPLA
jgi:signal transduction histidine kinase